VARNRVGRAVRIRDLPARAELIIRAATSSGRWCHAARHRAAQPKVGASEPGSAWFALGPAARWVCQRG
jgi:hypothetical protein